LEHAAIFNEKLHGFAAKKNTTQLRPTFWPVTNPTNNRAIRYPRRSQGPLIDFARTRH
jgi:hypothetical protein